MTNADRSKDPDTSGAEVPVRGLHVATGRRGDAALRDRFIREALPQEGVNLLVVEINYGYAYTSYPQVAEGDALTRDDLNELAQACRDVGVELVPQISCLGHQSWGGPSHGLLRAFPEFDERPDVPQDASRDDLYCRSYCPLHPDVHEVVFGLIDELAGACQATDFHVGMDEVFFIAEEKCPRCGGKNPAEVFAGEVKALHDHLARNGRTMWMWGDRFIDGKATGLGKWSASMNDTAPAVDAVPKDIVICDWHYTQAPETAAYFLDKGFRVVASPWQDSGVALRQLEMIRSLRKDNDRALGMLQTTWCGFERFARAYYGELDADQKRSESAIGAANCFKTLFAALRGEG
ncbi:MAG: family 20 glycosylhydrolase [Candidatus Brocadiae bacterium]|nr:family 20 glycosylhydrolase [Candidatus Brocadiia bacterium]